MSVPPCDPRLTRTSLIRGLRRGSHSAWNDFIGTFGELVVRQIRKAGVPSSDEADVGQEVFAAIVAGVESYRHDANRSGSFRAWMSGITRHKIADYFARQARQPMAVGSGDRAAAGDAASDAVSDVASKVPSDRADAAADEQTAYQTANQTANQTVNQTDETDWVSLEGLGAIASVIEAVRRDFQPRTWEVFWRIVMHDQQATEVARELGISATAARQAKYRVTMRMRDEFDRLGDDPPAADGFGRGRSDDG